LKQLYFGGPILTMEDVPDPEAVLVVDGRIEQTGRLSEFSGEAEVQRIDLKGRALLPAFLDPHSHLTAVAQTLGLADLSGVVSFEEIKSRMCAYMEQANPQPGEWVIGFGYDPNSLQEKQHPTKLLLDEISSNPVVITHASGHMGVMNTAALEALNITEETPDPEGGRIGRMAGSREPDGFLEETAFTGQSGRIPRPTLAQQLRQLSRAEEVYFRHGITTIQDGLTRSAEWELLHAAAEQNLLRADVVCYVDLEQSADLLTENPEYCAQYHHHLKIDGYKIFLDGSPQGRTAWMSTPYCGEPEGYCGYPVHPTVQIKEFVKKALLEKMPLLAHCNGDAAAEQLISCMEEAMLETGREPVRPVMIHAQLVRRNQLARMAKLGMFASFFTAHSWHWGDVHLQNFGLKRAEHISPAHSAKEFGVPFTFHQDSPVIPPDMIETVWCAVNRRTKNGVSLDGGEKIDVLDALKAVTLHAAEQYGEQDEKGSIREGKRADFVILSEDPRRVPPDQLKRIRVLETIREGQTLFSEKQPE
jgi:predicted amidohydrolase YtcJ